MATVTVPMTIGVTSGTEASDGPGKTSDGPGNAVAGKALAWFQVLRATTNAAVAATKKHTVKADAHQMTFARPVNRAAVTALSPTAAPASANAYENLA